MGGVCIIPVWYEYGSGVSTSKNDKWKKLLEADFDKSEEIMKDKYADSFIVRCLFFNNSLTLKESLLYKTLKANLYVRKKAWKLRRHKLSSQNAEELKKMVFEK